MTDGLTPQETSVDDEASVVATDEDVSAGVVSDGAYSLFIADFADTDSAWATYEDLKAAADGVTVKIEGVVVVKREADGKVHVQKATDHSTKKGLTWGLVGGAVIGLIFPPSIIGSAAVAGAIGAAGGKARDLYQKGKLAEQLEDVIVPGHSGIVALVSDPGEVKVRNAMAAANALVETTVDSVAASQIKAAAKEAKAEDKAEDKAAKKQAKAEAKAAKAQAKTD